MAQNQTNDFFYDCLKCAANDIVYVSIVIWDWFKEHIQVTIW